MFEGSFQEISRKIITEVYEQEGKNISQAAKRLGLDRNTIRRKLLEQK
jgi:ActR/RegA family two-component response regulator